MLLAVDRRDLLELLAMQDAIADVAQDIAGLLVERRNGGAGRNGRATDAFRQPAASPPANRRT
jgi:hypothetical protein